ncbi:MAG: hypothetical protein L6Q95_17880 [Planctomycetes bacterium]|nr:hypothetical protein [Planctomycetota bacterium]
MRRLGRLLPLLALLPLPAAADETSVAARDILRKAVEAQGKLAAGDIRDVTLTFVGEVSEKGEEHAVTRTYRFRAKDRSFRVHTAAEAVDRSTERGVFGDAGYWERSSKGTVIALSRGNRDDEPTIRQIETERKDFERMLRMVLLTRIDKDWTVTLGAPEPQRLDGDHPHELNRTLGKREEATYHVLDARRDGEAPLRLFVNTSDFTVRKAVEYEADAPGEVRWVYYFALYAKDKDAGIVLPRYFSVYRDTPSDKETRDRLNAAKGQPKVALNTGLADADLRPAP